MMSVHHCNNVSLYLNCTADSEASLGIAACCVQVQALEAERQAQAAALAAARAAHTAAAARTEDELNNLTRGVVLYKHLGLEFERVGDDTSSASSSSSSSSGAHLKLIFTQIDAAAPAAQFTFTVAVDAADTYGVYDCAPPVSESVLQGLLRELNASNDFSAFVCGMRREFVLLARAAAA
jgi:Chromosome segregation protein Spc25